MLPAGEIAEVAKAFGKAGGYADVGTAVWRIKDRVEWQRGKRRRKTSLRARLGARCRGRNSSGTCTAFKREFIEPASAAIAEQFTNSRSC
jgi:hypothetical protein